MPKVVLSICLLLALTIGCKQKAPDATTPPPAEVSVLTITTETVKLTTELPGRINPAREAQVRARATGIVFKRLFTEGATVKEGDVLFEIDPAPLQAVLNSAKANQSKTEAILSKSRATAERYKDLVDINAISKEEYNEAQSQLAQHEAELKANLAVIQTAELNLSYTKVTAPISGRIGKALVTEGALVSATEATQMALIRQMDPIYLDITQSSTELMRLRKAIDSGSLNSAGEADVALILDDGSRYNRPGKLLFSDVSVDPTTGMVTLRAEVPNPDQILLPGMFARAELVQGVVTNAVSVPQRTIARGAAGEATVLVVNQENKVELRRIEIGREVGTKVLVSTGLNRGERIIVQGSQKAPPGSTVTVVPFNTARLVTDTSATSPLTRN